MGGLFLGFMLYKFVKTIVKTTKQNQHSNKAAEKIKQKVDQVQVKEKAVQPKSVSRQDIREIYKLQKEVLAKDPEIKTHQPYIVTQTTVLHNYLSTTDIDKLAENKLSEVELLDRLEQSYDNQIHTSFERAAQKVGFINTRQQVRSGPRQVASYSDGQGHGVRVAIDYEKKSQTGIDLIGYSGSQCETKREELLAALAEEGIELEKIKVIKHNDPDGFKVKENQKKSSTQQKRRQRSRQLQQIKGGA